MEGRVMRLRQTIWPLALFLSLLGLDFGFVAPGSSSALASTPSGDWSATAAAATTAPAVSDNDLLPLKPGSASSLAPGAPNSASPASGTASGLPGSWLSNTLVALVVVVGLILLIRLAIGRFQGRMGPAARRSSPAIEVLSRVALAPRNHLLLVRIGQRLLVLGDSPHGLTSLANLDNPQEVAAILLQVASSKPGSATAQFQQMLAKMSGQYQADRPENDATQTGGDDREADVDRARSELSSLSARLKQMAGGGSAGQGGRDA